MTEPIPVYQVGIGRNPSSLPLWLQKMNRRALQVCKQPGEYIFVLVITEDGRKQLRVTAPAAIEELGT